MDNGVNKGARNAEKTDAYWWLIYLIPLAAILAPGVMLALNDVPLAAAMLIGIPIGFVAFVFYTAVSGNDTTDLVMSSILVIVFSVVAVPLFIQAKKHQAAIHARANPSVSAPAQPPGSAR